ncbi:MAG: ribonuclease E/G [Rhodospirillales bacterium]
MSRIVIETRPGETRAAVLDQAGEPVEFRIERETSRSRVGALCLGRVKTVRADIGAAFVDIGAGQDGFLNLKSADRDTLGTNVSEGAAVLVQVTRDAAAGKGPALSTGIDLVGAALVLTPGKPGLGLSGRISDDGTRARLKSLFADRDVSAAGIVIRTDAAAMSDNDILAETARLDARWQAVRDRAAASDAPACLIAAPGLAERLVNRYAGPSLAEILVDDAEAAKRLEAHVAETLGAVCPAPVMTKGGETAFAAADLEDAFDAALSPHVMLPGGGGLIVTETPAMTTVDVNAGRAAAGNPERLALETNLAAAGAIAHQLRLRGIGGLIAVDFMKMREDRNRQRVLAALGTAFRGDPDNPRAGAFSRFGLVDVVRQNRGASLAQALLERGDRLTPESAALEALEKIRRRRGTAAWLRGSPEVCRELQGPLAEIRKNLERRLGFVIRLEEVPGAAPDHVEIEDAG